MVRSAESRLLANTRWGQGQPGLLGWSAQAQRRSMANLRGIQNVIFGCLMSCVVGIPNTIGMCRPSGFTRRSLQECGAASDRVSFSPRRLTSRSSGRHQLSGTGRGTITFQPICQWPPKRRHVPAIGDTRTSGDARV